MLGTVVKPGLFLIPLIYFLFLVGYPLLARLLAAGRVSVECVIARESPGLYSKLAQKM